MSRHHTIISGTGRNGTTFLMQLLTVLGLDTGFTNIKDDVLPSCNAGMELDLRKPDAPYIVKSPWLCDLLGEILYEKDIIIDHAFIPIRDLYSAAESRRSVQKRTDPSLYNGEYPVSGGLWHTDKPEEQETVLVHKIYKLMHTLAQYDIETTLLYFPRIIYEPQYLYKKMTFLLQEIAYDSFLTAFQTVARPQLVNNFIEVNGSSPLTSCLQNKNSSNGDIYTLNGHNLML